MDSNILHVDLTDSESRSVIFFMFINNIPFQSIVYDKHKSDYSKSNYTNC